MKRRTAIKWLGLGGLLTGLGLPAALYQDRAQLLRSVILGELSYLQLDEQEVDRFASDHLAHIDPNWDYLPYQAYHRYYALTGWAIPRLHLSYRRIRLHVCAQFLRSTDFFAHQQRCDRPIRYLGYYSPYHRPCRYPK